jgi:hypothetical protein
MTMLEKGTRRWRCGGEEGLTTPSRFLLSVTGFPRKMSSKGCDFDSRSLVKHRGLLMKAFAVYHSLQSRMLCVCTGVLPYKVLFTLEYWSISKKYFTPNILGFGYGFYGLWGLEKRSK